MVAAHPQAQSETSDGPVSVVIPTYNRAGQLERVLGSYLAQPLVGEVIVVVNGSTDRTLELLESWATKEPLLRIVRRHVNGGQAGARNAGAEAATGRYLFYGEDDYEPTPGQVATLLKHLLESGADIIAGRRINVLPGESYSSALRRVGSYTDPLIERWAMTGNHHRDTGVDVEAPLLDACVLMRVEVLHNLAFDPRFRGNGWREETDFQLSALEAGYRLVHCPHTWGFHSPGGLGGGRGGSRSRSRLNYELWVVRNNAQLLRKHWTFLRSGCCDLNVAPSLTLTLAIQTLLRAARGLRKLSRQGQDRLGLN